MVRPDAQVDVIGEEPGRGSDYPPISPEQFDLLDADVLFAFGYGDASDVENREVFKDDPLLQRLDVAERGAIYDVNSYTWYVPSAYGVAQVLRDLDERLLPDLIDRLPSS